MYKVFMKSKLMYAIMAVVAMAALSSCEEEDFNKAYDEKTSLDSPYLFSEGYQDSISYPYDLTTPASSWLGMVKDNTPVCQLSIPGTHDTMTGMGFYQPTLNYIFNVTAISQLSSFQGQMEMGIRFFDLRPVVSIDTLQTDPKKKKILRLAHGISEINVTFEESLDMMQEYLKNHPSEFFIAKIQCDNGIENQSIWAGLYADVVSKPKYASLFVPSSAWTPGITVGDMRGKVLVLNRFDLRDKSGSTMSMPGVYCTWTDEDADIQEALDPTAQKDCGLFKMNNEDDTSTTPATPAVPDTKLWVQDYFKTNKNVRLENKKKTVIDMMNDARTEIAAGKNTWIINHCSAYTEVSPRGYLTNASIIHPLVIKNLLENTGTVGIMPIDMACHDYIHCIINGGTPYTSDYLYGFHPLSQSLTNLLIKSNKSYFK
jgi:hypothetical protein